jgi:hypothetical protein
MSLSRSALCGLFVLTLSAAGGPLGTLEVRLLTPLRSTDAKLRGQTIEAILMKPLVENGQIRMPARSILHGSVHRASGVGIGVLRERASLEIEFTDWETPEGHLLPMAGLPLDIDNAREQVDGKGRIRGILAASNPLGVLRGMWFRPSSRMLMRAPGALTGTAGTLFSEFAMGPLGELGLLGLKLILTRFPDPEIDLPVGTEMTLRLDAVTLAGDWGSAPSQHILDPELAQFLRARPEDVQKFDQTPAADIINVALIGSGELLREAFLAAGWSEADTLDRKSFAKTYKAFTQRQGYAAAPVSKLLYQGRLPDLVFQKSLNSIAKRHHVRLWRVQMANGQEVWLGAATHDITVVFEKKTFGLSHRIDRKLDVEREKVVDDLNFAEASHEITYLPRTLDTVPGTITDGGLAVIYLQPPAEAIGSLDPNRASGTRAPFFKRMARRGVLETRQYLLRDNAYYLVFAAGRKLVQKARHIPAPAPEATPVTLAVRGDPGLWGN